METEKKYLIMLKKKVSLIENHYSFYKSNVSSINNIIDNNIDVSNLFNELNYLGKVRYNKLRNSSEFYNSFDDLEGNLLIKKGITEDKFIFVSERYKSIELFCLIDRYFYSCKKKLDGSGYYSRITAIYGDTIDNNSFEIKKSNSYLDCNLIDNMRKLFEEEKLSALENANCCDNLNLNLNIKFINAGNNNKRKDDECVICLEKLGKKYTKLSCKHRFHLSCLEDWIKTNKDQNDDDIKKFKIICPLCRDEKNAIDKINLLDSKIPSYKDGKAVFDFSPIKSNKNSQKNIQLVDFLGNIGFKMLKISENCYSLEYDDDISSKMNHKICIILSMINIIS